MKTTAIIVAAGSGSRFRSDTPKQFALLAGKPLIVHTLEKFEAAPSIDAIVLVLSPDEIAAFKYGTSKLKAIVSGGKTRAASVLNGLIEAEASAEMIAVHDGARPLVSVEEIELSVAKARTTGAACLVGPVADTIKTVRGGEISGTLDRENLRRALTPQVFRVELLKRAFELGGTESSVTDECYLVEKLGHPIAFVEGRTQNIKITYPEDLALAEALLRTGDLVHTAF